MASRLSVSAAYGHFGLQLRSREEVLLSDDLSHFIYMAQSVPKQVLPLLSGLCW